MARRHIGEAEVYLYSFFNLSTRWGGWSKPRPGCFTSGKDPAAIIWEVGEPQGRSGRVRKISPIPGFDPPTVKLVASRYTDHAVPALYIYLSVLNV
jgi:hypothetical protein